MNTLGAILQHLQRIQRHRFLNLMRSRSARDQSEVECLSDVEDEPRVRDAAIDSNGRERPRLAAPFMRVTRADNRSGALVHSKPDGGLCMQQSRVEQRCG